MCVRCPQFWVWGKGIFPVLEGDATFEWPDEEGTVREGEATDCGHENVRAVPGDEGFDPVRPDCGELRAD